MPVGGHQPGVLAGQREEHPVQRVARLVVRDREAGRGQHLAQRLRLEPDPCGLCRRHDGREVVRRHTDELVGSAAALEAHRRVVLHAQGEIRCRQLLDDLGQLARRHRDSALAGDPGRHRDACAHLEIRRRQAHRLAVRLEQDIGEDRQRLTRLDDVLDHLQALEERVTVEDDFHR